MESARMTLPVVEAAMDDLQLAHRELLRVVDSLSDNAWQEPGPDPGWTHRDILAHVASNDIRVHARLHALLGEPDEARLRAVNDLDGWNQRMVEERRDRSVHQLIDEFAANRHETLRLLSRVRPEHLSTPITMTDGSTCNLLEYIAMITEHEAEHAGHLDPASKTRRSTAP
jgi:uncharacterized protein (TIGR03083 family)